MDTSKINVYVFLDNVPFASEGIIFGLEQNVHCNVKSYFPMGAKSSRSGIDSDVRLKNCLPIDYAHDLDVFKKEEGNLLQGALFISFGYLGSGFSWASSLAKNYDGKCYVISERPTCVRKGRVIKTPLVMVKHYLLRFDVIKKIDKLFCMGDSGRKVFRRLGWPENKLVDYFYCPIIDVSLANVASCSNDVFEGKSGLDFVYSGRFVYRSKGVGRLIPFFKKHPQHRLFVIGDYGEDASKFKCECSELSNVIFLGKKRIEEVARIFERCDYVCIPSKVDGWNVNVNIALSVGTPCIITDAAGSDSAIKKTGCGIVTRNSKRHFLQAMECVASSDGGTSSLAWARCDLLSPENAGNIIVREFLTK